MYRSRVLLSGVGGRKAPSSMGQLNAAEVLRLRATSAVSLGQSVRRSAQDDDFVAACIQLVEYAENTKRSEKSQPLSEALCRSIAKQRALWRGVEEPVPSAAEEPRRCLFGDALGSRKLQRKIKSHKLRP